MEFGFEKTPLKDGDELERAYFGSVKNKYEALKNLGKLPEETYVKLSTALKNAEALQPSETSPLKPEKPFAFDLRRSVWKKLSEIAVSSNEKDIERRKNSSLNLLSLEPKGLRFYSTVQFPCMDRAAHVDGYFILNSGNDERIVICDLTLNEAEVENKKENVDVVILSPRILDKNTVGDKKDWEALIDNSADDIVDHLLGPKESLKVESKLKNEPLKTNIKFKDEY